MKPTVGLGPSTGTPLSRIRPSFGRSSPATRLRMVLLPQPEGPTTATNSPGRTSKLTRSIAVNGDTPSGAMKRLVTPMRSSTDAVFSIGLIQRGVDARKLPFQDRGGPCARGARRPLHPVALERAGDVLEILRPAAEDRLQGVGKRAFLGRERTPQGLMS